MGGVFNNMAALSVLCGHVFKEGPTECRVNDKLTHPTCSFPRLLRYVLSHVVTTMWLKTCLADTKNYGAVFTSFHHWHDTGGCFFTCAAWGCSGYKAQGGAKTLRSGNLFGGWTLCSIPRIFFWVVKARKLHVNFRLSFCIAFAEPFLWR